MTDTPDRVVSGVGVNAAGDTLPVTVDNMAADTYVFKVKVDAGNGYWTASPVGMATVNVAVGGDDQRTNGGGWVADPGSANGKSNFGFSVRVEKKKDTPKGNFVFVFRGTDGFNYVVKSNTWNGGFLNFAGEAGTSEPTRAAFRGRCDVQKVDPATGLTVQSWGNFTFTVDVRDGDVLIRRDAPRRPRPPPSPGETFSSLLTHICDTCTVLSHRRDGGARPVWFRTRSAFNFDSLARSPRPLCGCYARTRVPRSTRKLQTTGRPFPRGAYGVHSQGMGNNVTGSHSRDFSCRREERMGGGGE